MKILLLTIALFIVGKSSYAQTTRYSSSYIRSYCGPPPPRPVLYLLIYRSDTLQIYTKALKGNIGVDRIKKVNVIKSKDMPKEFGDRAQNGAIAITYKGNSPTNILDSLRIYNTASR